MKLSVVVFSVFVIILFSTISEAYISINIDPDDFDQVSDFFHGIINNGHQNLPPQISRKNMVIKMLKGGLMATPQLIGVMFSLVGASVISSYLLTEFNPKLILNNEQGALINASIEIHSEKCKIEYGCHENRCWRSCHSSNHTENLWCYTAPTPNARRLNRCQKTSDCFLCWECVEPCHA